MKRRLHGFHIETAGRWPRAIEKLVAARGSADYRSPTSADDGNPVMSGWLLGSGRYRYLDFAGSMRVLLDDRRRRIRIDPRGARPAVVEADLAGPVITLALRDRGTTALHASGVATRRGAVIFVGDMGVGKSSIVLALQRRFKVLTDDVAVLQKARKSVSVEPGPPTIRARSASHHRVRTWRLSRRESCSVAQRLFAIYILERRPGHGRAAAVTIEDLHGHDVVPALLAHTWWTRWPNARARRDQFEALTAAADQSATRRVVSPTGENARRAMIHAIVDDLRLLGADS